LNGDNTVEHRAVQLGPVIHGFRVIREGLKPDDWLIVSGMQRARPGLKVAPEKRQPAVSDVDLLSPVPSAVSAQSKAG